MGSSGVVSGAAGGTGVAASSGRAVAGSSVGKVVGSGGSAGGVVVASATVSVGGSVEDMAVVAFGCCEVCGLVQATSTMARATTQACTLLRDILGSIGDLFRFHQDQ